MRPWSPSAENVIILATATRAHEGEEKISLEANGTTITPRQFLYGKEKGDDRAGSFNALGINFPEPKPCDYGEGGSSSVALGEEGPHCCSHSTIHPAWVLPGLAFFYTH